VAVRNYDVIYIKGECRIAPRLDGVLCGCGYKVSIKACPNRE
jgi:hypothetical protein